VLKKDKPHRHCDEPKAMWQSQNIPLENPLNPR